MRPDTEAHLCRALLYRHVMRSIARHFVARDPEHDYLLNLSMYVAFHVGIATFYPERADTTLVIKMLASRVRALKPPNVTGRHAQRIRDLALIADLASRDAPSLTQLEPFLRRDPMAERERVLALNSPAFDPSNRKILASSAVWLGRARSETAYFWPIVRQRYLEDASRRVWVEWFESRIHGWPRLKPWEEEWASLSVEQWHQNPPTLNHTLMSIREGYQTGHPPRMVSPVRSFRRARAIFLGHGGAGKTSLINVLNGEAPLPEHLVTRGVEQQDFSYVSGQLSRIHDEADAVARVYDDPRTGIGIHFWDFGGQVMAHGTHRFFLRASCVYVIVLDGRHADRANSEAAYWLDYVRAFASETTPVIVVGNKSDIQHVSIDLASLQRRYPNVVDYVALSCREAHAHPEGRWGQALELFRSVFLEQVERLASRVTLPRAHFETLLDVQRAARSADFITDRAYQKICEQRGVHVDERGPLLALLDQLGVALTFPQMPFLRDYVLNPRWLTYGVYTILYDEATKQRGGRLTEIQAAELLLRAEIEDRGRRLRYPPERAHHVIDAMEAFQTAYRLSDRSIVIPSLLPLEQPRHPFDFRNVLAFRFQFEGLLPPQLLPSLIVNRHREIAALGTAVWRNGVILAPRGGLDAQAFVEADSRLSRLEVSVGGQDASTYLGILRDDVRRVLEGMPDLPVRQELRLGPDVAMLDPGETPPREPVWVVYDGLRTAKRKGAKTIIHGDHIYSVNRALQVAPSLTQVRPTDVFLSYSGTDRPHAAELATALELAGISVWWDQQLRAHHFYRNVIGKRIRMAKAVIVLWSRSGASEFVCAEANLAGPKLIGLLGPGAVVEDVPLPFNERHVSRYDDVGALRSALEDFGVYGADRLVRHRDLTDGDETQPGPVRKKRRWGSF
ncbi:MAG: COR domain-containing protein [Myxococcota bacterium]